MTYGFTVCKVSLILLITLSMGFSQILTTAIGVKGGVSVANFWGEGVDNLSSSFTSGVSDLDEMNSLWTSWSWFSQKEILPNFASFQTELNYTRMGKQWQGTIDGSNTEFSLLVDYIQMPYLLQVLLPFIPLLKTNIYAGPQLSFAFQARADEVPAVLQNNPFFSTVNTEAELLESLVNTVNLGMVGGIDVLIPAGPGGFVVDLRYQMDFLNTFNNAPASEIRNYAFVVLLGYSLDISGSIY